MTREFLKNLGLEDAAIDSILDENMRDIGKEKSSAAAAQNELPTAQKKLEHAQEELPTAQKKLEHAQEELQTLKASGHDIAALQQQLAYLQAKYDKDTGELRSQLADREYSDAVSRAIAGKGLKFSSKSAERAFTSALREAKLELKDGELAGLDDFIKAQQEADPDAFAPDKAPPRFLTGSGGSGHGQPPEKPSRAAQLAAEHHASLYGKAEKE